MSEKWKGRYELPVMARLDGVKFDINRLREELATFAKGKVWDGLGSDYAHMCETHTKLPKMFFKEEELEEVECVCDLDWERTSYQQLSLTEFDESYDLSQRMEMSGSVWDTRVAKKDPKADERWYRKIKDDVPPYLREILNMFSGVHRTRGNSRPKIDYKNVLDEDSFARFSIIREIRLDIARTNDVPAYAVFSDREMAELAKVRIYPRRFT